jgi:hypothetical protein
MAQAKGLIFDGIEEATEEEIAMYATLVSPPPAAALAAVVPVKARVPKKPTAGKTMFGVALSAGVPVPAAPAAPAAGPAAAAVAGPLQTQDPAKFGEFAKVAEGIQTTSYSDPYSTGDFYPLRTRLGFQQQILKVYNNFLKIPEHGKEPDYDACKKMGASGGTAVEMYEYQKFVREYVRQASPYRGLLVYHGLGSGKTCSAIAAAEALFSVSRKKIIVMTPSSLRYNFIREISFCGFRHLRLQNHWEAIDITPENKETAYLFATQVLNMSKEFATSLTNSFVSRIWVPNFDDTLQPNFKTLDAAERKEIVKQVENQINNSITFINYNGVRAAKLKKYACDPPDADGNRFFDNSVIVIDEIHNLTRLMQGTIEPYLTDIGGGKRKVPLEPVTPGPWEPALCKVAIDDRKPYLTNYKRGYLLYRLLSGARNSKIIGLSGTPLINFPEEIAILVNLIGGYVHTCSIKANPSDRYKEVKALLQKNAYVDFEEVETLGGNVQILFSILPEGMMKTTTESGNLAVQRIPPGEVMPTIQETATGIVKELTDMGLRILEGPTYKSEPLLPPVGEEFRENFIDGLNLKNTVVLRKRLQGLISYYRGSKKELMPAVTKDEVVFVQFSEYARKQYEMVRTEELAMDDQKKKKEPEGDLKGAGKMGNLWAEIYDLAKMKQSNSYRMSSRQACNFSFPEGLVRPRPRDKRDFAVDIGKDEGEAEVFAAAEGAAEGEEEAEFAAVAEAAGVVADDEDLEAAAADDAAIDATVAEEDAPVAAAVAVAPAAPAVEEAAPAVAPAVAVIEGGGYLEELGTEGGGVDDLLPAAPAAPEAQAVPAVPEAQAVPAAPAAPAAPEAQAVPAAPAAPEAQAVPAAPAAAKAPTAMGLKAADIIKKQRDACIAQITKAASYPEATKKLKECLIKYDKSRLFLYNTADNLIDRARANEPADPKRLAKYSPKYAEILKRILTAPGSSLVYSQFLDMEGIGIFSLVLQANAFHAIEIVKDPATGAMAFTQASVDNIKLGKGLNRFLTFTGASGKDNTEVRNMALKVFNAKYENESFAELSPQMSQVLVESGYTGNVDGSLCRAFCITAAGAEGLSLKNVRRVHIMEPFWNHVRTDQVKGRAVRICSHIDLDLADRNVEVFTYCSVFDDGVTGDAVKIESKEITSKDAVKPEQAVEMGFTPRAAALEYTLTSDQYLYQLSERKKKVLQNIQNLMKTNAVDCGINKYENEEEGLGCITLPDKPQQYAFHPILKKDIAETSTQFPKDAISEAAAPAAAAAVSGAPAAAEPKQKPAGTKVVQAIIITLAGTPYISVPDPKSPLTRSLYGRGDTSLTKKLGEYSTDAEGKRIGDVRWIRQAF